MRLVSLVAAVTALSCGARTGLDFAVGDAATADVALLPEEICDGIDNDRDGAIDEDIAPISCGVGACVRSVAGCVNGSVPPCVAGMPSRETCNAVDDDCNGAIDDGLPFGVRRGPITVGSGADGESVSCELEITPTGLLALWRVGFRGENPVPTTRTRLLDANGDPVDAIRTPATRAQTQGPRATPTTRGDLMVTYCARVGTEDLMTSVRMNVRGELVGGEVLRSGPQVHCGAVRPDAIWTGERHVFGWTTNTGLTSPGYGVYVDVADENGRSLSNRTLGIDGELTDPPRFARHASDVLMLLGRRMSLPGAVDLRVYRVDVRGNLGEPPTTLAAPAGARPRDAAIAFDESGTIALALAQDDVAPGLLFARLAPDGRVVEPLRRAVDDGVSYSYPDVVARGSGFVAAANGSVVRMPQSEFVRVFTIDHDGRPSSAVGLRAMDESWTAWPSIAIRDGRVFVLYIASLMNRSMQVRLAEFGCTNG